jgi:G3E family GTPase
MTRAHVITGSFGAGKTTAIRHLMARKPVDELWVVILNEFSAAGIDALTVAQDASGAFEVRLVAGGCLCCVGELEFAKQLRDILRNLKPTRLLIEPSGAGHAADIVDVLCQYEAQGALQLEGVICLIDPTDVARIFATRPVREWSQIQSADVLLLSKPDLAGVAERDTFRAIAAEQYPAKSWLGECSRGAVPPAAWHRQPRLARFSLLQANAEAAAERALPFALHGLAGREVHVEQLGLHAVQWLLPRELTFARSILEPRLGWLIDAYGGFARRMKGVFRTGPGPSLLAQLSSHGLSIEDSAHRLDSRVEVVLSAPPGEEFLDRWREMLREAANL